MRIIFAGSSDFSRVALEQLHSAGFAIPLVLTQPDRPAGRGLKMHASPVKQFALEHAIAVAQPRGLRLDGKYAEDAAMLQAAVRAAAADAMVVAAYGLILPRWLLAAQPLGCLNIHASLLPRWRGAAPIQRAIAAGDAQTGVTIMQMDTGLDTGDILLAEPVDIAADETGGSLLNKLAWLGGRLIIEALKLAAVAKLEPRKQPDVGVTYAHKIEKAEAVIDWSQPAEAIARQLRAFDPAPGAGGVLAGQPVKLWRGLPLPIATTENQVPGTIVAVNSGGVDVCCGRGCLRLTQLQRAGGKRLAVAEFLRGFSLRPGMVFQQSPK